MSSQSLGAQPEAITTAELIEQVTRFDGPPEQFLDFLLRTQCNLADADAGAILRRAQADQPPTIVAMHPALQSGAQAPAWLAEARRLAGELVDDPQTRIQPLAGGDQFYGQEDQRYLVVLGLRAAQGVRGCAAYLIDTADTAHAQRAADRLEMSSVLLSVYEMRLAMEQRSFDVERLRQAEQILSTLNEHDRFKGAAMAVCNDIAARFSCERVSLGFSQGRYIKLAAISHTEKFTRKMTMVQDVEAAMEECADQDIELIHPRAEEATYVDRATARLSEQQGPSAIVSLPLRRKREVAGVLTLERRVDAPWQLGEVETLRLAGDLVTARLCELREHDRWFGARFAAWLRRGLAALVGPRHTWAKVLVIAIVAAIAFLTFARGTDKVEASFVIEPVQRYRLAAPYNSYIEQVFVEPDDEVQGGQTVLAKLDTDLLEQELAAARAEMATFLKQADTAMRDGKTVDAQIAQAEADRVAAQITLLEYQIERATIRSPIDGVVIAGDLTQQLEAPVSQGDVLFEVAPLESLRAEMLVPEDRINDLQSDQPLQGMLAVAAAPGDYVRFEVERINPVAELIDQRNVFRVRIRLLEERAGLRPGMEGIAKTHVGRRSYLYLWTRELIDWIRMKLWI